MKEKQIKVKYFLGGWPVLPTSSGSVNEQEWEGDIKKAMDIALAEIHEHAGASSPAYAFTNAIFGEFKKGIWS